MRTILTCLWITSFARTDNPEGNCMHISRNLLADNKELQQFIELCFDPSSPYNERLKETMIRMLGEMQGEITG